MSPPPANLILGTAGHIDHGKTSLVKALTGVDTDRLAEEKRRGITIELGFARYAPSEACSFGIVDVPGHEAFVRTMVAGATGMDVVLLVVAADEGVMPQTREHVAVVRLLGVERMVVALTKADLADEEWLALVAEDVSDLLAETRYAEAEMVPVSAETGEGLDKLAAALLRCAEEGERDRDDLARMPVDRVFAVDGAGTVATGTLWSGRLERGRTVRILPGGGEARIRAVEVHGESVGAAEAGQRAAVALTGAAVRRGRVRRGDVLVDSDAWRPSMMLTVELAALDGVGWTVEHGQRVRVHLGTAETFGRVVLFSGDSAPPGVPAPAQLRLESPVVARNGDRFVIRSYSPLATIAGGLVLEPSPPKRKRLSAREREALAAVARGGTAAVRGAAVLAGWQGLEAEALGVLAGWRGQGGAGLLADDRRWPREGATGASGDSGDGAAPEPSQVAWRHEEALFDLEIAAEGEARILEAVRGHHRRRPLDAGAPLDVVRNALPSRARAKLADGLAARLARDGRLVVEGKTARLPEFRAALAPEQEGFAERAAALLEAAGLEGPSTEELLAQAGGGAEDAAVLDFMAGQGRIRYVGDAFWVSAEALNVAVAVVTERLAGLEGLGPKDFREVLPVSRKRLIPLLAYLDSEGTTVREPEGRRVPARRRAPRQRAIDPNPAHGVS